VVTGEVTKQPLREIVHLEGSLNLTKKDETKEGKREEVLIPENF
jgi:hypothetical protein